MNLFRRWRVGREVKAQILASYDQDQPPWQAAWNLNQYHEWEPIPAMESYPAKIGVGVYEADPDAPMNFLYGIEPRYSVCADHVEMPARTAYRSAPEYYLSFAHELIHATGAAHRLDRLRHVSRGKGVAREEIVATAGACLLLAYHDLIRCVPGNALSFIRYHTVANQLTFAELKEATTEAHRAAAYLLRG
ncbi:MAG: hypothetical protein B7W99_00880 [Rhodospirillales bacterium 20-58-10]|nr:MAG: hypothetical protein B7W99_00880 [Rhodospirillales bacterium 20-58-10]